MRRPRGAPTDADGKGLVEARLQRIHDAPGAEEFEHGYSLRSSKFFAEHKVDGPAVGTSPSVRPRQASGRGLRNLAAPQRQQLRSADRREFVGVGPSRVASVDVYEYFATRERECAELSLAPDTSFDDMFAEEDGSEGQRGFMWGRLDLSERAFLNVLETVVVRGSGIHGQR